MKTIPSLLAIALFVSLGNIPLRKQIHEIVLTADEVFSASDIEIAFSKVTNSGTRPGTVTLDSRRGPFIYSGDDRSINIFYSNLTLRSRNEATIDNCADGVFFDDAKADNILIEGLIFNCSGGGVAANTSGQHRNIVIRNNVFRTGGFSIEALHGNRWVIRRNRLTTTSDPIRLYESSGTKISDNTLEGFIGIVLSNSGEGNIVTNNRIIAKWQGVLLSGETMGNKISNNGIYNVQTTGIVFENIMAGNKVTANKVACWPGIECQAVYAEPVNYEQNIIVGNKIVKNR